jgi:hypothetical protein
MASCEFKEKQMLVNRSIAVFLAIALFAAPTRSQTSGARSPAGAGTTPAAKAPESPLAIGAGDRFVEIARELVQSKTITGPQADQAVILLAAARNLNAAATDIDPLMFRAILRNDQHDYSDHILLGLESYVGQSCDRVIVMDAIRYLLDRLDSPDHRKILLETLVKQIGNRNPAIDSELAMLLAQLSLEKGEKDPAKFYLLQAYTNNKYNKAAFAKLAELAPNDIGPAVYLEHLRLILQENPLDINSAVAFAQYAERLQLYDLASQAYLFCAQLFQYLYPSEPLPPHIYLPWSITCYNSRQNQQICIQIAQTIRNGGQFDLFLEAVAGKAAAKTGDQAKAQEIFSQAEKRAAQVLQLDPAKMRPNQQSAKSPSVQLNAKQIAWFYCFARVDAAQAIAWANQAYSAEPNSPSAGGLLAYALAMSGDMKSAKTFLAAFEHTQVADLALASVQAAEGDKAGAIKTLNAAIAKDAGSLAAETAKDMLRALGGGEYAPPLDTGAVMTYLTQSLGQTVAPRFFPPDKMLDVQFSVLGGDYTYGNNLDGVITITNKGADPLVVSSEGLFRGGIQIAAQVSGSLTKEIPDLLSQTVRTDLLVPPGKSFVHTVRLSTGELRRLLMSHPQAALDIQFTLYLDPVTAAGSVIGNRLVDLKPVVATIKRPATELSADGVRGRFNAISSGPQAQKIQTAHLFTGLLREHQIMSENGTLYPYRYKEWVTELLQSSLTSASGLLLSPNPEDWVVKVETMADLLLVPLDSELATAAAKNLNNPQWPVRLMAVCLLASNHGENFRPVLDWVAKQDSNELVRSLATSLQSAPTPATPAFAPTEELPTIKP